MSTLTARAAKIAYEAHREGVDALGRDLFAYHVAGVVARVGAAGGSPTHRAVAWLHDVVEDTNIALWRLEDAGMPEDVLLAVDAITRRPNEIYADYIERVCANPIARMVKLADNAQNLADNDALAAVDPARALSLRSRYLLARERLQEADQ